MSENHHNEDQTQSFVPLTNGMQVGNYKIISKIGAGGMGEVYLARDSRLDREVALKFLPRHLSQNEEYRSRFTREAQAAARLSHANIVHLYEVSEYQGQPYFSMEMVEGRTLREIIKESGLSLHSILSIAIQMCSGLAEAHEFGVIHRDIKPSNILIDRKERVKLLDFGLASIGGESKLTKTGSTLGTVGYMSPEQVKGEKLDHRSDIFSLGVVLYELLTSHQPFRKDNEGATGHAILNDIPEPLARYKSGLPGGLQHIIDKSLSKDKETRYQHADEMLADLKLEQQELSRPSGASVASKITTPHRTSLWLTLMAIVIVLVVVISVMVIEKQPSKTLVPQRQQLTFRGTVHMPEISPDGQHIAYLEYGDDGNSRVVMVQDIVGGEPIEVFRDMSIFDIRWSPDGNELLLFAYNDSIPGIVLVPRLGGAVRRYRLSMHPFAWSPKGDQFAMVDYLRDRVLFVDKNSGDTLPGGFEARVWDMDWSPNGKYLATSEATDSSFNLSIYSLVERKWIRPAKPIGVDRVKWSSNGEAIYFLKPNGATYVTPPDLMKISIDPNTGIIQGEPTPLISGLQTGGGGISFSRDGRKLVYRKSTRWSNLWRYRLESEGDEPKSAIQLTSGTSQVWGPSISPDGSHVAYSKKTHNEVHIFTLPIDGGSPTQVTHSNAPNWSPAWSPDSKQIAYSTSTSNRQKIAVIDPLGGVPHIFEQTMTSNDGGSVIWSPGDRILYRKVSNFSILDPNNEEEESLMEHDLNGWAHRPYYSPDGRRVVVREFEHEDDSPGQVYDKQGIAIYSIDSHKKLWLISLDKFNGHNIGWSSDGNWLYRLSDRNDSSLISAMRIEDSTTKDILLLPPQVTDVAISPNCSTFVYVVGEGQFDAWLIENFDPDVE